MFNICYIFRKNHDKLKEPFSLLSQNDKRVKDYDDKELVKVLSDNCYHSLEELAIYADVDKTNLNCKRKIYVYNPSWHSEEV